MVARAVAGSLKIGASGDRGGVGGTFPRNSGAFRVTVHTDRKHTRRGIETARLRRDKIGQRAAFIAPLAQHRQAPVRGDDLVAFGMAGVEARGDADAAAALALQRVEPLHGVRIQLDGALVGIERTDAPDGVEQFPVKIRQHLGDGEFAAGNVREGLAA